MKAYIYKGVTVFAYKELTIKFGDTIYIDESSITVGKSTFEVPNNILDSVLKDCEEITYVAEEFSDTNFLEINKAAISRLITLGILKTELNSCRDYNIGNSDYSKHVIQPWAIWQDYNLNAWDADIIKRVLRTKKEVSKEYQRILDYQKIIHICKERIRQLDNDI